MAYEEITSLLGGWPGFALVGVTREPAPAPDKPARIILELAPAPEAVRHCSRCREAVAEVHEVTSRLVRDLPILDADTWLKVPRARVTRRFAESVARLCQVLPIKHVAQWFGLGWDTVKQIDARALAARLGPVTAASLAGVRTIAIDEFALQRGQR